MLLYDLESPSTAPTTRAPRRSARGSSSRCRIRRALRGSAVWRALRSVTLSVLAASSCSTPPTTASIEGTYYRSHGTGVRPWHLDRAEPAGSHSLPLRDCLRIERDGRDVIAFDIVLNQANPHSCSAEGLAHRQIDASAFEVQLNLRQGDTPPCRVRLTFLPSVIMVDDVHGTCHAYCGAHARMKARFERATRVVPPVSCDDSILRLPDPGDLEDILLRLLQETPGPQPGP